MTAGGDNKSNRKKRRSGSGGLDEDELGDMLEEMDLDEDIEDGIAQNDLGKALN